MFLAPGAEPPASGDRLFAGRDAGAETRGDADPPPWGLPASPGKGQPRAPPGWPHARAADSAPATASARLSANRNMSLRMNAPPVRARLVFRDWFSATGFRGGWTTRRARRTSSARRRAPGPQEPRQPLRHHPYCALLHGCRAHVVGLVTSGAAVASASESDHCCHTVPWRNDSLGQRLDAVAARS